MTYVEPSQKIKKFDRVIAYVAGMIADYDKANSSTYDKLCWMHLFDSLAEFRKFQDSIQDRNALRNSVVYGDLPMEFPAMIRSYYARGIRLGLACNDAWCINMKDIGLVSDLDGNICSGSEAANKFEGITDLIEQKASKKRKSAAIIQE